MPLSLLSLAAVTLGCVQPVAIDGDTIRCANLDAPELPGHCRRGRVCAPGDPRASRAALAALLRRGPVLVTLLGRDRYHRHLALVAAGGVNLSCAQIAAGQAIYKPRWDPRRRVALACPPEARP